MKEKKNRKIDKTEINKRCPQCGKTVACTARENTNEVVVKIRWLKYHRKGGPVSGKCRHCGRMVILPDLRAAVN